MVAANRALRDAVVKLRNQRLTMTQIAGKLRISVNSVAGYCKRARLAGIHVETVGTFGPQKPKATVSSASPVSPVHTTKLSRMPVPPADARTVPLSRHRKCQFIAGEKGGKRRVDFQSYLEPHVFCGEPALEGSSYCPKHHAKTHIRRRDLGEAQPASDYVQPAGNTGQHSWR